MLDFSKPLRAVRGNSKYTVVMEGATVLTCGECDGPIVVDENGSVLRTQDVVGGWRVENVPEGPIDRLHPFGRTSCPTAPFCEQTYAKEHDFQLELVVTRKNVPDARSDDALNKLREIEQFAAARGFIHRFAIAITSDVPEKGAVD